MNNFDRFILGLITGTMMGIGITLNGIAKTLVKILVILEKLVK